MSFAPCPAPSDPSCHPPSPPPPPARAPPVLLPTRFPNIASPLLAFIQQERPLGEKKGYLKKDEWNQIYPFLKRYDKVGLDRYDEDDAWPVLIDDFVEAQQELSKKEKG